MRNWYRHCSLLSFGDLPRYRSGLVRIKRQVVDRERKTSISAGRLLAGNGRRPAGRVGKRKELRRVIKIHEKAAVVGSSDGAREDRNKVRRAAAAYSLRRSKGHLHREEGAKSIWRSAKRKRSQVVYVGPGIRVAAEPAKAIGGSPGKRSIAIGPAGNRSGRAWRATYSETAVSKAGDENFIGARRTFRQCHDRE